MARLSRTAVLERDARNARLPRATERHGRTISADVLDDADPRWEAPVIDPHALDRLMAGAVS